MDNDESKKIVQEFIKKEAITEFDAVHPRFLPENEECAKKYQAEHYFFCAQCNLYMAPTVHALKVHFLEHNIDHKRYGSCMYCKEAVYEYTLNGERQIFHICGTEKRGG